MPEDAEVFYETYQEKLEAFGSNDVVRKQITELNEKVEIPFSYYLGYSSESMDYLTLYLMMIMLAFAIITAPLFSAEYQTGADSILRCTKHGRMRLAVTKIAVAVLLFLVTFAAGIAVFLLVTNLAFGMDGLKTSVQLLNYIYVIPALTVEQTQAITVLAGMITVFAALSCTLFLSARCRNVQTSMMMAFLLCILPIIIYMMSSANLADIIRCVLPTGGLGLMNSFLYELLGRNFVQIGSETIWTPYLMIAAELVEIPVLLGMTVRTYCKRDAV